jgi:hypothetical protein
VKRSPRMLDAGGVHAFRLRPTRANTPRAKPRYVCYYGFVATMDLRLQQLERMERWAATAGRLERFQVGLIGVLFQIVLTLWLNPLLPPLRVCDANELDLFAGFCAVEPIHADSATRMQSPEIPEPAKEDSAK